MTDPIADLLTRIRNAQMAKHPSLRIPFSRMKMEVAKLMVERGFILSAERVEDRWPEIEVRLKYNNGVPAIKYLNRISKPGNRVYASKDKLPYVLNGLGVAIISTSQGIMDDKTARQKNVGGEVLCELY